MKYCSSTTEYNCGIDLHACRKQDLILPGMIRNIGQSIAAQQSRRAG
ncbi:MAG: hypothetical protein HY674_08075 [Chloroflexi bacterium]|nr:hypothetical protein [Chloroflexota bacterium]